LEFKCGTDALSPLNDYKHEPVLVEELKEYILTDKNGIYVDCTLGMGGHAEIILKSLGSGGKLIAIDRDEDAVEYVKDKLSNYKNIEIMHENFINIGLVLNRLNKKQVDGIYFDLGISLFQVQHAERGFSYMKDGPLDMRMDKTNSLQAGEIVNYYSEDELADIIDSYGEERWARRIARFIIKERKDKKITRTTELVDIIKKAIPASARRGGPHPAKRTFQALRIAVNDELEALKKTLEEVSDYLKPGGRVGVISFHSLEDRIVKHTFRYLSKDCICPPDFPVCKCDKERKLNILTKGPITPSEKEIERNHRSRSAKLRVAERIKK